MATMQVELVSVEGPLWSGEATAVFARTIEGEIGILPGHAPLLGALAPGWLVRIQQADGVEQRVAVHGGFLSVRPDGVSVLAEMAENAESPVEETTPAPRWETAECTCPDWCERDHEQD